MTRKSSSIASTLGTVFASSPATSTLRADTCDVCDVWWEDKVKHQVRDVDGWRVSEMRDDGGDGEQCKLLAVQKAFLL